MAIKRIRILLLAFALASSYSNSAFAEPLTNDAENKTVNMQQMEKNLSSFEEQSQELEHKIEKLDAQIIDLMSKIEDNDKKIQETESSIIKVQEKLHKTKKDIEMEKELFYNRVRAIYMNGVGTYLDVLLSSKGFDDLANKLQGISNVMKLDKEIMAGLNSKSLEEQRENEELQSNNNELKELKSRNVLELGELNKNKAQIAILLAQVKTQENLYSSQISEAQKQVNSFVSDLQNTQAVNAQSLSRGTVSFSAQDILSYAIKFLGIPYLWGGTSPQTGFDCSGFTQYVFAHFGINIERTTYQQIDDGVTILDKKDLKPGDLVFFGTVEDPHHVGIYMGNNYYIHAPRTGDVIKVAQMTRTDFLKGVRVIR